MRLFFALELPSEVRAALGRLRFPSEAYRWVEPSLLHVTLAFLGEQPEERLPALSRAAMATAAAHQPAQLQLGEAGSFGPRPAPRVLWVGLAGELASLERLQRDLAWRLVEAGVRLEERPFRPHITLARRRERSSGREPLPWPPARGTPSLAVPLADFVLMRSQLSPAGPHYTVLERFPLV